MLLQGLLQQVMGANQELVVTSDKRSPDNNNAFFQLEVHKSSPYAPSPLPLTDATSLLHNTTRHVLSETTLLCYSVVHYVV